MPCMVVTCDVSKLDTLSDVKPEQPLNIRLISVTCDVLKLDKSRAVKALLLENISCILVIFEVSKLDTSRVSINGVSIHSISFVAEIRKEVIGSSEYTSKYFSSFEVRWGI